MLPRPFTDWTPSAFWGPGGELRTEAPVFSKLPRLPTMLGQFVHTFPLFRFCTPETLELCRLLSRPRNWGGAGQPDMC